MVTVAKKSEPNTLQSRMGFTDTDLKTAGHDAIMLWLNENIQQISRNILGIQDTYGKWSDAYLRQIYDASDFEKWWGSGSDSRDRTVPIVHFGSPVWEYPITTGAQRGNKYTVGFVDLRIEVSHYPALTATQRWRQDQDPFEMYWKKCDSLLFEVKTAIPSLGEIIRQIRYYQEYERGIYVVVSPDARWKDALESQEIRFVLADGNPVQVETPCLL